MNLWENQPDQPREGLFKMRLVKKGPWVAVKLVYGPPPDPHQPGHLLDRSWRWQAWIDGHEADIWRAWPSCSGQPINEAEYRFLLATSAHARQHEPDLPEAAPEKPVDFGTLKLRW